MCAWLWCVQVDESQAKLVSDEERTTGGVQWETVEGYIMASGGWAVFSVIMATFGLSQLFQVAGTFWLQVGSLPFPRHEPATCTLRLVSAIA
jgi:hypothetical protein